MKVAVQQEDLQMLAKTLQEQLFAEVPSAEVFEVKCAVNKDGLMILTQHPSDLIVNRQIVFAVFEEVLLSLTPHREQQVQCYLRVFGEKLPYAQCLLTVKPRGLGEEDAGTRGRGETALREGFPPQATANPKGDAKREEDAEISSSSPSSSSSIIFPPLVDPVEEETGEEEAIAFDPFFDDAPNLLPKKPVHQVKPILLGAALVVSVVFGAGGYLLTRPCVLLECKEIQVAEQFKIESRRLMQRAKSQKELLLVQQQLEAVSTDLTNVPGWSTRYQQAEELKTSLSGQSEKINQVVKALDVAALAAQKIQAPVNSLEELQARQHLWRQAIAPLEAISPNSELYELVQAKLLDYRINLLTVNQQMLGEEKWLKKLSAAKAVASTATKQAATAKSLRDFQKVQSTWQLAVNALNAIPRTSPAYQETQKLLAEYKPKLAAARDRATKEQLAAKAYQQAISNAKVAKTYEQQHQWQAAVTYWEQALQTAKQISGDSSYYNQAQTLITPYSTALKQAQEKLQIIGNLQQTRTDLEKTCVNGIRICSFNINNKGIIVQLTPEYDQVVQNSIANADPENSSTSIEVSNHLQTLREALAVIAENANQSLFLFDAQGQEIYTRTLAGD
ncbi:MAG: hypothetical protein KME21_02770 [Desmonostoc vinosum HA7617-LM4]|nr:hypothetical protein [Desmonostoc vinosum HA7617-LM4]